MKPVLLLSAARALAESPVAPVSPGVSSSYLDAARTAGGVCAALLLAAGMLHLIPRTGRTGRRLSAWFSRAPGLDALIAYFTVLPIVAGAAYAGWRGVGAAVLGQVLAVLIWTPLHELAHPAARRGPRIVHALNRSVGRVRNHAAVWITALAVPVFAIVRLAELVVYPPLTWLVRFPRYRQGEWVNVSRHKFQGCLYCDWMTGVWSLGSEMLRNVESFWCPIRFDSARKCENCRVDFPDVDAGWVPADAGMHDVAAVLASKYPPGQRVNAWFGHPVRLTVDRADPAS